MKLPRVLVVEDDRAIRSLLAHALSRHPVDVETAANGVEALEKIAAAGTYDVVVIDLVMPRMDGYLLLEKLQDCRDRPRLVLVMSASDDAALLRLDAGLVHAYIRKPFDLEQVVDLIGDCAEMIGHSGSGGGIARSSDAAAEPLQQRDIDAC